jgi:hypothetical protein
MAPSSADAFAERRAARRSASRVTFLRFMLLTSTIGWCQAYRDSGRDHFSRPRASNFQEALPVRGRLQRCP